MVTPELRQYILTQLQQGAARDELKKVLLGSGWPAGDVEAALAEVPNEAPAKASAPAASPTETTRAAAEASGPVWPTAAQPRRRLPKRLGTIVAVAAGVLIVGGGAWAYSTGYLAYLSYRIAPQRLTAALMDGLAEIKSVSFSGDVSYATPSGNMGITFTGTSDSHDPSLSKSSSTISLRFTQAEMAFGLSLELRSLGEDGYVRLAGLDAPAELRQDFPLDFEAFTGRWIHVSRQSLGEIGGAFGTALGSAEDSAEQQQKLAEQLLPVLKKYKPIDITEALGSERVDGVPTFHFAFAFNREELTELLVEAMPLVTASYGAPTYQFDPEDLRSDLADANLPTGEVWVGKRDHLPHRIELTFLADGYPVTFTLNLSRYGEAFPVEVPASAEELKDIIEQLTGPLNPQPIGPEDDVTLDTDADGLTDVEETRDYQTNPNLADTDGDGYGDGQEAFGGYSPTGSGQLTGYLANLAAAKARAIDTQTLATLRQAASMLELRYAESGSYGGDTTVASWADFLIKVVPLNGFGGVSNTHVLAPLDAAVAAGSNVDTYCVWAPSVATPASVVRCKAGATCGTVTAAEAAADGCR